MSGIRSDGMPKGSLQAEPVIRPEDLTDAQKKLISALKEKYETNDLWPVLESLLGHGTPLAGISRDIDEDYIIRKFLQIAVTSPRTYDRILALEKIARMKGFMKQENTESPEININFDEKRPAGAEFA